MITASRSLFIVSGWSATEHDRTVLCFSWRRAVAPSTRHPSRCAVRRLILERLRYLVDTRAQLNAKAVAILLVDAFVQGGYHPPLPFRPSSTKIHIHRSHRTHLRRGDHSSSTDVVHSELHLECVACFRRQGCRARDAHRRSSRWKSID